MIRTREGVTLRHRAAVAATVFTLVAVGAGAVTIVSIRQPLVPSASPVDHRCVPPSGSDALGAAYLADPLLRPGTYGLASGWDPSVATPPGGMTAPALVRYCDEIGVVGRRVGKQIGATAFMFLPDPRGWYPSAVLRQRLDGVLPPLGWRYGGLPAGPDSADSSAVYCATIDSVATTAVFDVLRHPPPRGDPQAPTTADLVVYLGNAAYAGPCPPPRQS
jgi:hypothetical protein